MCGLPMVAGALFRHRYGDAERLEITDAYARSFWSPETVGQLADILLATSLFLFCVLLSSFWYSWRNGRIIAERYGRPVALQVMDQISLSFRTGLLPPWYYIFDLFLRENRANAGQFLTRAETKQCIFPMLSSPSGATSPLGDKAQFAAFCEQHQIVTVPVILVARDGEVEWIRGRALPDYDLFLKPVDARGGRGAERWDFTGEKFRNLAGVELDAAELLERISLGSRRTDLLLQPRICNHPDLGPFSNGVLTTVRVLSCLDEVGEPEIIGAVFRMAIGSNRTVDNVHAGGIIAAVDLDSGRLGRASNLGTDARLGWLDAHPDTGCRITGESLPMWADVKQIALRAHRAFCDRTVIGWDVGITIDGPILVEGNYGPDVDMMQRPTGIPLGTGRFGHLIAHQLRAARTTRSLGPRKAAMPSLRP